MTYWKRITPTNFELVVAGVAQHFNSYRRMRDYCTKFRIVAAEQTVDDDTCLNRTMRHIARVA